MDWYYHYESDSFFEDDEDRVEEAGIDVIKCEPKRAEHIAILGDLHFGARSDSPLIAGFLDKFLYEFFTECRIKGIGTVIQLGDLFDKRKNIQFDTLQRYYFHFQQRAEEAGIDVIVLVGNHDAFYRNSLKINSPSLLCRSPIQVIDKPTAYQLGGKKVHLFPWICEDNEKETQELINLTDDAEFAFGHLELEGFMMYPGIPCEHGMSAEMFSRYQRVFTGHFHTRNERGNIAYVGTPIDLTWSDCGDQKYWVMLDLESTEEKWIPSRHIIHRKIDPNNFDISLRDQINLARGCKVKIIPPRNYSDLQIAELLEAVECAQPDSIEVIAREDDSVERADDVELASNLDPLVVVHSELKHRNSPEGSFDLANSFYTEALAKIKA